MDAIELFSGIGGFRVAADTCAIKTTFANDIDPLACKVYRDHFGDGVLHEGDVRGLVAAIPRHDLLTAGFPCQPFSSAGKKRGIRDPRGTLFEVIVDVVRTHRPRWFVLENVKRLLTMERGLHFATILASLADLDYLIEWRLLNAMHLGLPQNRQRVFIVGEAMPPGEPFRSTGTRLKSTRLASLSDIAHLSVKHREDAARPDRWRPIENHGVRFPHWGLSYDGRFFGFVLPIFSDRGPSVTLKHVLERDVPDEFDFTDATLKWIGKNRAVERFVQGVEILSNQSGGARMGYTIFGVNGVAPTLTSTTSRHYERYRVGDRYRRLTNVEYARIQGFDDDHCRVASVYDQYSLYGNAVPPPMAKWVLERLSSTVQFSNEPRSKRQRNLFEHA
ncbi:MAG: DNA (cytosine-5-)-methyltransferase [Planctomycetota bacterium]|nr:MAG: DNA (cytosine-5-)-methyltransferase [Planctomycetota bacterium]